MSTASSVGALRGYYELPTPTDGSIGRCRSRDGGSTCSAGGALRGGLWRRFWEQRRRRRQHVAIGKSLDRLASLHGFTRRFLESDASFRERIRKGFERP